MKKGGGRDAETEALMADLQRQIDEERDKNRQLEDQFKYRVGSFVKRETQAKKTIETLERQLQDGTDDEHRKKMGAIRTIHNDVISGLNLIQNNTAKILQDQEKDLMRAFRARLHDVTNELENQRNKKGDYSAELQERHKRVVAELHASQELAQIFDKKNQQLAAENKKLVEKLSTREDDRQCLLKELEKKKNEVARLNEQVRMEARANGDKTHAPSQEDAGAAPKMEHKYSQRQLDQARLQQTYNRQYEREVKYRDATQKLKRMVEQERKHARVLRDQQANLLQHRTELEVMLRQCLDDVKAEVARKRAEQQDTSGLPKLDGNALMSVHELTAQDRERVLELLLSQQRVVQLLYSKAPPQRAQTPPDVDLQRDVHGMKDDMGWLDDIMQ